MESNLSNHLNREAEQAYSACKNRYESSLNKVL